MGVAERRAREREERREGIVEAAQRVFFARGLDVATMEEIATAAEVSKGALYLHFKGKDELYIEVLHRIIAQLVDASQRAAAQARSGREEIELLLRQQVAFGNAQPDHFRLGMSWLLSKTPIDPTTESFTRYSAQIRAIMTRYIDAVRRGQHDGTLRADLQPELIARQLWAGTVGVMLLDMNHATIAQRMPDHACLPTLGPGFVDLLLAALCSGPTQGDA